MEYAHDAQKTKSESASVSAKVISHRKASNTGAVTRIPQWATLAYGNEVPPSLRLPTHQPPNTTGLPDILKTGVEALSGVSLDDVQVHYNSPKPTPLQALAYTQGTNIHVAPGQEKHLPHEAWHVVQQKQGRVQPTLQARNVAINDNQGLEKEADVMGQRALQMNSVHEAQPTAGNHNSTGVIQRLIGFEFETGWLLKAPANAIGMHTAVIEGTGWKVVPDRVEYTPEQLEGMGIGPGRTHTGSGSMEFVTSAFDENAVGPGGALDTALGQIEQVGTTLNNAPRGFFGGQLDTPLSSVIGGNVHWGQHLTTPGGLRPEDPQYRAALEKRENLLVRRIGPLASAPQMTGGIKHSQLIHLLDRMSRGPGFAPPGQRVPGSALMAQSDPVEITIVAECVRRARIIGGRRVADNSILGIRQSKYEGVLAELGSYVQLARAYGNNIPYEKAIAPLLSRTDFGQLPLWIRNVPTFVNDVLLASGRYAGGDSNAMNGQGGEKLFVKPGLHDNVTARGWVTAIQGGHDPLTWEQDRTNPNWNPQLVGQAPNQALGHVYEFRRLVKPLPFNQWRQYALDMAQLVVLANQGTLQ